MGGNLRKSGIDIIGNVPWGTQFCQFYQTKEDLIDILIPYFKTGLENNEFCFWVTSQPLEAEEAKEALRKAVPDIDVYLGNGQIEIVSFTCGYANEGVFDSEKDISWWVKKLDQVLSSGYDGLRMAGNTSWLKGEWNYFLDYEIKMDGNFGKRQMISLCPFSLDMCSAAEIIDIAFKHQFALIKREGKWERIENTGRENTLKQKKEDETLRQSEENVRLKSETVLSPAREMANLELAEIIDIQAIQSLMDNFNKLTHMPLGLNDLKGNVLAGIGWQDICTRFHRVHAEACKHCVESSIKLSLSVAPGEFKLYRCKNNMLNISIPIIIGDQQVGILFAGQFFFEDEPLDYELFKSQAKLYGFNEEEYIAALEKVPRLSRETVDTGMDFFMKLAHMISQLRDSNIKLARSLAERDALVDALQESETRCRMLFNHSTDAFILSDPRGGGRILSANPATCRMLGWAEEELIGRGREVMFDLDDPAVSDVLDELIRSGSTKAQLTYSRKDGTTFPGEMSSALFTDSNGEPRLVIIIRDITERKKDEEAFRLSNIYNRSLIEANLDPLVTIGRDCKIKDVNSAYEQVTGYSKDELIGTVFSDYCTEPEKAGAGYQQVFINGEVRDYPLEIQHRDGHITPVLYNASVYKDEDGKVIGVFAAARDISELKKAEEALKRARENLEEIVKLRTAELEKAYQSLKDSEKRLAEAQKMAHIGNWEWDIATDEAYWSEGMYRIFGRDPRELAPSYNEYLSYIHPDDRDYYCNAIKKAVTGSPFGIDYRIVLANGEERIVHLEYESILDDENAPVQIKGIVQDITESKRAEEKIKILADAVESSDDAIITISLEGIITSWNKGAEQIYGYSAEEILGKNALIVEPANLKGEIKQLIEKIRKKEKVQRYRTLRIKKDGTIINTSITLSPILDASGEPVAISAIVRDITERIRAEEALAKIEEARKKEIHHRIKNNLQVISSLLDLQAEKFRDKKVLEAFRESQSRVFSMSLIHEELYKGEGIDTVDFSAYLQKLAGNLLRTYNLYNKNVLLYMDLDDNAFFNMDTAVPLGIIVNELFSNSLKHAFTEKEGEIRIRLCREEMDHEISKSLFSLAISDNGKGIPEHIELENVESLGLQLVSILVNQLDGDIKVNREHGTEFIISFSVGVGS